MNSIWHFAWEMGWRSSAILIAALIAAGVCRRRLLARQAILQITVVALFMLPLTIALPKFHWRVLPSVVAEKPPEPVTSLQAVAANPVNVIPQALPAVSGRMMNPASPVPPLTDPPVRKRPTASRRSASPSEQPAKEPAITVPSDPPTAVRNSFPLPSFHPFNFGVVCYALGLAWLIVRLGLGYLQIRSLRKESAVCVDPEWQTELELCRTRLAIASRVELRASELLTTPLTYGHRQPVLVVPIPILEAATRAERQAVLLHELTHIHRRDFAWRIAVHVVQAIYWLHPLAWWFGRVFAVAQEDVCDAICAGEFGTQPYSEILVNVVRSVRRSPRLTLGLAMSRTSRLAQRLGRIQRQGGLTMSRISQGSFYLISAIAVPLVLATMLVQPVRGQPAEAKPAADQPAAQPQEKSQPAPAPQSAAAESDDDDDKVDKGKPASPHVVIRLLQQKDAPLKSKLVKVHRYLPGDGFPTLDPKVIEIQTDESGVISIPLDGIAADVKDVDLEIEVAGYARIADDFRVRRTTAAAKTRAVILLPSIHLSVAAFDADGRPLTDGRITVLADIPDHPYQTWELYLRSTADGHIEFDVPRDRVFGFRVVSDRGAPYRVVYPAGTQDLKEIHLQRGCTVAGQLLTRDGKPVPNCPVTLEGDDSQAVQTELEVKRHGGGEIGLSFRRKTDAAGRFKFPPMLGDVRIYLDCDENDKLPGIIAPVDMTLPSSGEKWLPLVMSPTGTITGTVKYADGKPASKVAFQLEIPPRKSNSYLTLSSATTDAQGNYSLVVPYPLEEAWIAPLGISGKSGNYFIARPAGSHGSGRNAEWHHVVQYVGSSEPVNWTMEPYDTERKPEPAKPTVSVSNEPLAVLERDLVAANKAIRETDSVTEQNKLDPRITMLNRCLEIEAQHRGTRVAIGALYFIGRVASTTSDKPVFDALHKVLPIVEQHYDKHPDVDFLLHALSAGIADPAVLHMLEHIAARSPYDYVRAAALLELVEQKREVLAFGESLLQGPQMPAAAEDELVKSQPSEEVRELLSDGYELQRRVRAEMTDAKRAELRASIMETLDRIINQYTGVVAPQRKWQSADGTYGPYGDVDLHLVDTTEDTVWRVRTVAERAGILRFQITRLQVGMVAPEIEGNDFHQQPIRLSQFRGKVVLLTASLGTLEDELYGQCAELKKKFAGQPFECVSVVSGSGAGGYSIRSIVEDGKITWPIVRDSYEDDIGHQWCQVTFPVVYIIDQQGVIRYFDAGNFSTTTLDAEIKKALKPESKAERKR